MKKIILAVFLAVVAAGGVFAEEGGNSMNQQQQAGYTVGLNFSRMIAQQLGPAAKHLDVDALLAGIKDGMQQNEPKLTHEQMQKSLEVLNESIDADMAKSAEEGQNYLAANKAKDGVRTTESGIQYTVIKEGTGKSPKATDMVEVHYKGMLTDGTVFDSSYARGEPATFPLNQVIPGWTEALQLMKEGAKWKIVLPSELAYGKAGSPPVIPADAVLVFEVELLKVLGEESK